MRRRELPGVVTDPAAGIYWWRQYPMGGDEAAVDAWSDAFHGWCDEHGVDSTAVTILADQLGLTDAPFDLESL